MDDNLKFWEKVARFYTPLQEKSNRELYDQVMARCRPFLQDRPEVLELACGTGQFTLELGALARSWEATDFSEKMVRELDRRLPEKLRDQVHTSVQDATCLDYGNDAFGVVFIANALHIMPAPEKALSEIRRVLRPGGLLIAPTFVYEGHLNRFRLWFLSKVGFKTYSEWTLSGLEDFLRAHGFEVVESEVIAGKLLPEGWIVCR